MTLPLSPSEPLILADGTKIDPATGKTIKDRGAPSFIEVPAPSEAQDIVVRTRRSIAELPLPTQNMNAVSLVVFYTMWGMSIQDIAIAVGITIGQVKNIKALDAYKSALQDVMKNVIEHEASDIRMFFQQKSKAAAQKIVDIAEDDEGVLGFKAAQDVLDRAGHRPADVVQHKHSMEGSLIIEVIDRTKVDDVPVLTDVTYKELV